MRPTESLTPYPPPKAPRNPSDTPPPRGRLPSCGTILAAFFISPFAGFIVWLLATVGATIFHSNEPDGVCMALGLITMVLVFFDILKSPPVSPESNKRKET